MAFSFSGRYTSRPHGNKKPARMRRVAECAMALAWIMWQPGYPGL
jgi:hypothetical protein